MNAIEPAEKGFVTNGGARIAYFVYGSGDRTIVFLPAWAIVHSEIWKAQIPYFARHYRVVAFDPRGNGLSDKSASLDYSDEVNYGDALAVMNATATQTATVVALSAGGRIALMLAGRHPERVDRLILIAPSVPLAPRNPEREAAIAAFDVPRESYRGWEKYNCHYWKTGYRDFLEFFFRQSLPEPHSTKQFEDSVAWGLQTSPETLAATVTAAGLDGAAFERLAGAVRCPVTVLQGDCDKIVPESMGRAVAEATHARFVSLPGSGHLPQARVPVRVNTEIRDAIDPQPPRSARRPARKRALFISSPIGLGHAQRDAAIASELRKLHPEIDIQWLAQHPVTAVLEARGESIHPASRALANESSHFESECGEHDLHAFAAIRSMDDILVNNFMVFYDLVREEHFDLVVGDEAWDVDHFLHEHPNEKRTSFVWMTDFVGWIPMPEGGEYERRITADYNAEMIDHVERYPHLRDRAIFVGDPDDVVPHTFGDDLPAIRVWTQRHYDFAGYVTGFVPPNDDERAALRVELGYRPDQTVCIVSVGGSGVGDALLRRIIAAYPEAKRRRPDLRVIVVAGPRIDPLRLPRPDGLEIRGYVPELHRHLSACDIALVQGGLTTTMELTASGRPFLYFPLRNHFEQNVHVRYRLDRYGAGRCMEYADANPDSIAAAIESELQRKPAYRPVRTDGAARAAALVSEVLA